MKKNRNATKDEIRHDRYEHTLSAGLHMYIGDKIFQNDSDAKKFWKREIKKLASTRPVMLPAFFVLRKGNKVIYRRDFKVPVFV